MHTFKYAGGQKWVVQFHGAGEDWHNIAWFHSIQDAGSYCSFLNGGAYFLSEQGHHDLEKSAAIFTQPRETVDG